MAKEKKKIGPTLSGVQEVATEHPTLKSLGSHEEPVTDSQMDKL